MSARAQGGAGPASWLARSERRWHSRADLLIAFGLKRNKTATRPSVSALSAITSALEVHRLSRLKEKDPSGVVKAPRGAPGEWRRGDTTRYPLESCTSLSRREGPPNTEKHSWVVLRSAVKCCSLFTSCLARLLGRWPLMPAGSSGLSVLGKQPYGKPGRENLFRQDDSD